MDDRHLRVTTVGGPTALLEIPGFRFLTDPTFDPPGSEFTRGSITLRKTAGPAVSLDALGQIDAVLLSHDQHYDNLDHAGRAMLARAGSVITTQTGSARLGSPATGLATWQSTSLRASGGHTVRVTAAPARHGPPGIEAVSGEVTGFVISLDGRPDAAIYVSGDTVWYHGVAEVAQRFNVTAIVLFMGAARVKDRGPDALTMTAKDGLETARAFPKATIVPVHYQGWEHFTEGREDILRAFAGAGLSDRVIMLEPGESAALDIFPGR